MGHADLEAPQAPCIVQSSIGNDDSDEPAVIGKQAVSSALQEEDATPPTTSKRFHKSMSTTDSPGEQQGVTLQEEDATPPRTSKRFKKSRSTTVSPCEEQGVTLQEEGATPRETSKRFKKSMSTIVSPGEQRGVTVVSPNPASKVKELSWKVRAEMVKWSRRYCMYIFV